MTIMHADLPAILRGIRLRGWKIAFAESCTGGRLSADLTTVPGSSDVVAGSAVCYQIDAKRNVLGIDFVNEDNVVSQGVAEAMALATRKLYGANIGVATTGYLDGDHPEAYWAMVPPSYEKEGASVITWRHITFPKTTPRSVNREIVVASVMEALTIFASKEPAE